MFNFRLLYWTMFFLFAFSACAPADSNDAPTALEATLPATAAAVEPTVQATETPAQMESESETMDEFVNRLQASVMNQDYSAMQALMDDPIAVGGWRSEWRMYDPAQTIAQFQNDALPVPSMVQFTGLNDEVLTGLLGQTPASMFGPTSTVVAALHSSGWGLEGNDEAILFVTEEDGRYAWSAFLYTQGSFAQNEAGNNDLFPFLESVVQFVMAQQDVVVYAGPGESYDELGSIFDGQTALVTGKSEDGGWWRVICPDDTVGDCWVTADRAFTLPLESGANKDTPITAEPVFNDSDLQFAGWSPHGRFLASFEYFEKVAVFSELAVNTNFI